MTEMLQYYIISNIIIAIFILLTVQHAFRLAAKEDEFAAYVFVVIVAIATVAPWICYTCGVFSELFGGQ